jgi:hypothetical protein
MAGIHNMQSFIRGNTFVGRNIARLSQASVALPISRAEMVITDPAGQQVYKWTTEGLESNANITGVESNIVTIDDVLPEQTAGWPIKICNYELVVWFVANQRKLTILRGVIEIKK